MFSINIVLEDIRAILAAVPKTLFMALIILVTGILIGSILAVIKLYKVPVLEKLVSIYLSYVRGIPLLVHLYIAYYALPKIIIRIAKVSGIPMENKISPILIVVVAYSLYTSAVQSENIRAALLSVEFGQFEAAYSIGLKKLQTMRRIIFPQALQVAIPIFFNVYLGIIKGLSLAFTVAVVDILAQAKLCSALNFGYLESYVAAGAIYWALCGILTVLFNKLEKNYNSDK